MDSSVDWADLANRPDFDAPTVTQKLIAYCTQLRPGFSCELAHWSMRSSQHIVKMVTFEDDVKWVARLPLPDCMDLNSEIDRFASDWKTRLDSEVATHGLIQERTNIAVPSIHGFDAGFQTIGWSFMLMDYIPGKSAREQLERATPEQDSYLLKQMADIQVELARVRMGTIGSIFKSSDGYVVGPDVETKQGPFKKPQEYYDAVAVQRRRHCLLQREGKDEEDKWDAGDLTIIFSSCLNAIPDNYTEEDFGLANKDLGPHNLIVDKEFKVIGMIDLDFVVSAPLHVVANLPCRWFLELDVRSCNLGVAKRTNEYLNALSAAGRQDFQDVVKTPLAEIWVLLAELDNDISWDSVPWVKLRLTLSFRFQKKSFVGKGIRKAM